MDATLTPAADPATPAGARDRAMVELLYASGLRASELCELQLSDFNEEFGVVRVVGKGNKQRLVPVGSSAVAAISVYQRDGRIALRITGLDGRGYTVQGSTNLVAWQELGAVTVTRGTLHFTNTMDPSFPVRFFRLRSGP